MMRFDQELQRTKLNSRGVSVIEALVALALFALNLLAWHASLHLVFTLLRHMAVIDGQATESTSFAVVCVPPS